MAGAQLALRHQVPLRSTPVSKTSAHLSSLVERDRLSMHMHAAARMDGCGSDSAAAICAERAWKMRPNRPWQCNRHARVFVQL